MKKSDLDYKYNNKYLYKRDINGNVLYWKCTVVENNNSFSLAYYYGQLKSSFQDALPSFITPAIESVNIGKSNQTSPQEQAFKRLKSEYENHLKKGYKEYNIETNNLYNIEVIENTVDKQNTGLNEVSQPMKFKSFELGKCKYPMIGQPKYNGVRCISFKGISNSLFDQYPTNFLSKELTEYSAEHLNSKIHDIINLLNSIFGNVILDGELYIPYTPPTTIAGAARNVSNKLSSNLQFIIYDLAIDNVSQLDRIKITNEILSSTIRYHFNFNAFPDVYISRYKFINSDEEAIQYLEDCLKEGYEGCVLRPFDKEYAFGQRPSFNRKLKKFIDAEFEIIDIVEYGDKNQKVGYGCKFICKNDITNGIFEAVPKGDYDQRLEYITNKHLYIGQKATIKFYERTINQLPFHGNVIAIRNYE